MNILFPPLPLSPPFTTAIKATIFLTIGAVPAAATTSYYSAVSTANTSTIIMVTNVTASVATATAAVSTITSITICYIDYRKDSRTIQETLSTTIN